MKIVNSFIISLLLLSLHSSIEAYIILPAPTQLQETIITASNMIAEPYPSVITLSNLPTKIDNLTVGVLFSTYALATPFLDVILEGPQGQTTYLFSDVGNSVGVTNYLCFISDDAPIYFPGTNAALTEFFAFFKPTDIDRFFLFPDIFPAPAPTSPYETNFISFKNINPNGDWKLYASCPYAVTDPFALTIHSWQLIMNLHPQNDYTGDGIADYVLRKRNQIFVVTETNSTVAITKSTSPTASVKGKVVGGADLDGDHISDLIVQKGGNIEGLKGPTFVSTIYTLKVKGLKAVASGDFDGDFLPDLYLQKKTSLFVALNTGTGFQAPTVVANKTLPKKFKVFGALNGRAQPAVVAQSGTTIAQLDGPTFSTPVSLAQTSSSKTKAGAIGQFIFGLDVAGTTILYQQKGTLSFTSPFVGAGFNALQNNELKGLKLVAPR